MGFCEGYLEREQLVILKESSVDIHSDLHGLVYINYQTGHNESGFSLLRDGLEEIYENM
jgi:predicted nucleotide-binding protein